MPKEKEVTNATIIRYQHTEWIETTDNLAVEEPLEIRIVYGKEHHRVSKNISITMRTPGTDEELAAGFLFTEGILKKASEIIQINHHEKLQGLLTDENVIIVELNPSSSFDLTKLDRNFYTSSSCGVCGKASIDAIHTVTSETAFSCKWQVSPEIIYALPNKLREAQETFESTGGLHAAAIFDTHGKLLALREDVGRHNALDKLLGHFFLANATPLDKHILLLSGRASFELLQKAAMAGVRMVCAVGAPSSLAVETAAAFGITLIGFLKSDKLNVYSTADRVKVQ